MKDSSSGDLSKWSSSGHEAELGTFQFAMKNRGRQDLGDELDRALAGKEVVVRHACVRVYFRRDECQSKVNVMADRSDSEQLLNQLFTGQVVVE